MRKKDETTMLRLKKLQSRVNYYDHNTEPLREAIKKIAGVDVYTAKRRTKIEVFCRTIFSYHCRKADMTFEEIGVLLGRHHSSIVHLVKNYYRDVETCKEFQELTLKVASVFQNKTEPLLENLNNNK